VADLVTDRRPARPVRICPFFGDQARCQASSVPGVTIRCRRRWRGSRRVRADRIARSGQQGRGRLTWRRSTVASWRRTRISMSLAAALRASNLSQPNTVTEIRYSSRNSTARDHARSLTINETAGYPTSEEFWHLTGDGAGRERDRADYGRDLDLDQAAGEGPGRAFRSAPETDARCSSRPTTVRAAATAG